MKAFKLTMMAAMLAFASAAMAQEQFFQASDVALDENGKGTLEVFIDYETTETVVGWNLSLYLPDGVTIATKTVYDEDLDEDVEVFDVTAKGDDYSNSNAMANALDVKLKADQKGYLFVCIDQKNKRPMKNTHGKILSVPVVAPSKDFTGEGKINTIGMTSDANISLELGNIADITFQVGGTTDGINDIQSADATAPAYNLQGIRVNNAKGLIIRDGKKMVVK